MGKKWEDAKKLCHFILMYEPNNKTAKQFMPLIESMLNQNESDIYKTQTHPHQVLDIILMTTVRAVAVLYSYHRLRSLHRSHSRFVLSLAGLFTVFSSFVFTCSVVNVMHSDLTDLK